MLADDLHERLRLVLVLVGLRRRRGGPVGGDEDAAGVVRRGDMRDDAEGKGLGARGEAQEVGEDDGGEVRGGDGGDVERRDGRGDECL